MKHNRRMVFAVALLCCLTTGLALGEGKKVKVVGLITTRTGESLTVRTPNGNVTVVLDDATKVQQPKGLGVRKQRMSAAVLIPGLKVKVDGTGDPSSQITAKSITFDSNDLEVAEMIQAGLHPTATQVAANQQGVESNKQLSQSNAEAIGSNQVQLASQQERIGQNQAGIATNQQDIAATTQRFNELSEYDVKGDITVNFASGSSTISASDKAALSQLAQSATSLKGYLIQVKGFADSSGNAAMNQQLSMDRAQEVIAYLIQDCKVPVRHVVAPGAMGTADPTASNETSDGRSENRRVEVKVLVNRGVAGS